jgi:hypothetical protein
MDSENSLLSFRTARTQSLLSDVEKQHFYFHSTFFTYIHAQYTTAQPVICVILLRYKILKHVQDGL